MASAGSAMVACLAGPGAEEDILLLDCDFLMSSFGEGLLALCTKRCLTQQPGDGSKVKTRIPLSHRVMSLAAMCVRHRHNRETSQRPGETACVALGARNGRLPIAEISHLVGS